MHTGPSYDCGRLLDLNCHTYGKDSNGYHWAHVRFIAAPSDLPSSYGWIRSDKLTNGLTGDYCLNTPF
jgi:hypothetical protein